jgi:hypothetical protein
MEYQKLAEAGFPSMYGSEENACELKFFEYYREHIWKKGSWVGGCSPHILSWLNNKPMEGERDEVYCWLFKPVFAWDGDIFIRDRGCAS